MPPASILYLSPSCYLSPLPPAAPLCHLPPYLVICPSLPPTNPILSPDSLFSPTHFLPPSITSHLLFVLPIPSHCELSCSFPHTLSLSKPILVFLSPRRVLLTSCSVPSHLVPFPPARRYYPTTTRFIFDHKVMLPSQQLFTLL